MKMHCALPTLLVFLHVCCLTTSNEISVCKTFKTTKPGTVKEQCQGQTVFVENTGPKGDRGLKGIPGECNNCGDFKRKLATLEEKLKSAERRITLMNSKRDCSDVARAGFTKSGIYIVTIDGRQVKVYCDLQTNGGKWLVFQRRMDGSVDFYRNWTDYEKGFGNLSGEFWLGLDSLHWITSSRNYELRVELEDWKGNTTYAQYKKFSIGNEASKYKLSVSGFSGNAGDSLNYQNNLPFSTFDRDHDRDSYRSCAVIHHGAWWYNNCIYSNLNGEYLRNGVVNGRGISWFHWKRNRYSMKRVEMKIRPM